VIKSIGLREIIFSTNCFIAAMLALFIAFRLDLKNPWWAMVTVYLTCQPLTGTMRARAVYRLAGTLLAGVAMVVIVPNLADSPELTTAAITLWVAACLYVSLLDRTPRSAALAISGYTAALVGFPSVLNPAAVWDIAIARVEEIMLGTVCAAVVHSVFFPSSVLSVLTARQGAAMANVRRWVAAGLAPTRDPALDREQRQVATDITEFGILSVNLPYDTSAVRPSRRALDAFDERLVAMLPLLSTIEDRIEELQRHEALPAGVAALLADVSTWFSSSEAGRRAEAFRLRRACLLAMPDVGPQSSWAELMQVNLLSRLHELITSWQECLELAALIRNPLVKPDRQLRTILIGRGPKPLHRDHGIALLSAIAVGLAMLACSAFWIASAWPNGATAVGIVAVVCSLFATFDDPTPAISTFAIGTVLAIPLAGIYQFGVLPAIDGYTWLVICLAPAFIPIGILMAIPRFTLIGLALAVALTVNLALQTSYRADLATFLNSATAFVIGALVGLGATQLMRVIGADTAARRLLRAGWRDMADLADGYAKPTPSEWASRMLDRVGLLMPRLSRAGRDPELQTGDALLDLRTGVNVIQLRETAPALSATGRQALASMLEGIAAHFRALARGRRRAPSQALLGSVDHVIDDILRVGSASVRLRGVTAAIGLRRNLFPDAAPYRGGEPRQSGGIA
jgi:uncharacterized membrane protein YccC